MSLSLQDKIQEEFDLERVIMPSEKHRSACLVTFPIFHSKDIARNPKLVVLVLGAGKVELGQWSRSLCMNKSLAEGSLMPFLHEAIRVRGCAVLLTNPNINTYLDPAARALRRIPGHGSPEDHLHTLYRMYVAKSAAKEVSIIAHSFGGVSTMSLLSRPEVVSDLLDVGRLKSITFTDSVHMAFLSQYRITKELKKWLLENAINFVRSKDPLGEEYAPQSYTQRQSAGTDDHASTSYACRELLWKWVDERMTKEPLPLEHEDASAANHPASSDSAEEVVEEDRGRSEEEEEEEEAPKKKKKKEKEHTEQRRSKRLAENSHKKTRDKEGSESRDKEKAEDSELLQEEEANKSSGGRSKKAKNDRSEPEEEGEDSDATTDSSADKKEVQVQENGFAGESVESKSRRKKKTTTTADISDAPADVPSTHSKKKRSRKASDGETPQGA